MKVYNRTSGSVTGAVPKIETGDRGGGPAVSCGMPRQHRCMEGLSGTAWATQTAEGATIATTGGTGVDGRGYSPPRRQRWSRSSECIYSQSNETWILDLMAQVCYFQLKKTWCRPNVAVPCVTRPSTLHANPIKADAALYELRSTTNAETVAGAQGQKTYISQVIGRSYIDYSSIYPPGYMLNIC